MMMLKRILILFSLLIILTNCYNNSNRILSKNIDDTDKKIETLKKYFKVRSPILDTEYDIYDVNINNRSIPGPTDRDYKIILKVDTYYLDAWTENEVVTSFPFKFDWANDLIANKDAFDLTGPAMMYSGQNKTMMVYNKTGIILIRIVQH